MAAQAGQARAGRGLAPSWVAVALGGLVVALTIAGLVAVVSAGQSVGQVVRLGAGGRWPGRWPPPGWLTA